MSNTASNTAGIRPSPFKRINPYFAAILIVWALATLFVATGADLSRLPHASQTPLTNTLAQLAVLFFMGVLFVSGRRLGLAPIDHTSPLGITRKDALLETTWLVTYMFITVVIGSVLNIHTHIDLDTTRPEVAQILGREPAVSLVIWAIYSMIVYVVLPLGYFLGIKRYPVTSLLLGFPKARFLVPFAIVTGIAGLAPFITPDYFTTPFLAHVLTFVLYMGGTLIPVTIFTQSLLAPRFALLTRSWLSGSVLAGVAYAAFNLNEYFLLWDSPDTIALSLVSLAAGDLMWGLIKGMSTLLSGSAWIHVFTTHTLHFADAPIVARLFGWR